MNKEDLKELCPIHITKLSKICGETQKEICRGWLQDILRTDKDFKFIDGTLYYAVQNIYDIDLNLMDKVKRTCSVYRESEYTDNACHSGYGLGALATKCNPLTCSKFKDIEAKYKLQKVKELLSNHGCEYWDDCTSCEYPCPVAEALTIIGG